MSGSIIPLPNWVFDLSSQQEKHAQNLQKYQSKIDQYSYDVKVFGSLLGNLQNMLLYNPALFFINEATKVDIKHYQQWMEETNESDHKKKIDEYHPDTSLPDSDGWWTVLHGVSSIFGFKVAGKFLYQAYLAKKQGDKYRKMYPENLQNNGSIQPNDERKLGNEQQLNLEDKEHLVKEENKPGGNIELPDLTKKASRNSESNLNKSLDASRSKQSLPSVIEKSVETLQKVQNDLKLVVDGIQPSNIEKKLDDLDVKLGANKTEIIKILAKPRYEDAWAYIKENFADGVCNVLGALACDQVIGFIQAYKESKDLKAREENLDAAQKALDNLHQKLIEQVKEVCRQIIEQEKAFCQIYYALKTVAPCNFSCPNVSNIDGLKIGDESKKINELKNVELSSLLSVDLFLNAMKAALDYYKYLITIRQSWLQMRENSPNLTKEEFRSNIILCKPENMAQELAQKFIDIAFNGLPQPHKT